jgi:hypothetical protein
MDPRMSSLSKTPANDTSTLADNHPVELPELFAWIDAAVAKYDKDSNAIPFALMSILKRISRACDGQPHNVEVYRKIFVRIESGEIDNLYALAKVVPEFVRQFDEDLCKIKVNEDEPKSPPIPATPKVRISPYALTARS